MQEKTGNPNNIAWAEKRLTEAGREYETILASLKDHYQQYRRLVLDIGVRESHVNDNGERAICLPALPDLYEYEERVAERLLALTQALVQRPCRVCPPIDRTRLSRLAPLQLRNDTFSPEALAQELAAECLGDYALLRCHHQAALTLSRYLGPSFKGQESPSIEAVRVQSLPQGRVLDGIASMRLADVLTNLTAVLEAFGLDSILAQLDPFLANIENTGRAALSGQPRFGEGGCSLRLSLRNARLYLHLSPELISKVREFVNGNLSPPPPRTLNWGKE